ncbi:MAG: Ig-like domain-containing protein [Candidatus Methanoperedens sp.]|nr:Ig-like domain-containing protein [Candidatus Methanoperedens sp.]
MNNKEILNNYIIKEKTVLILKSISILLLLLSSCNIASADTSPDLIVQDITWSPTNPSLGDTVTFTTTIQNQGNGTSNAGYVYFYLDGLVTPLTSKTFTTINAGSTTTVSFTWGAQAVSHSFEAVVDKDNKIPESDETNNEKTITFSASLSDLIIQEITPSPTNPSIGDQVTFTTIIKNQGSGSSSNGRVYFYLDGSTSHLTYKDFGGLSAGASATISFTWNALSGSHTFRGLVDKDNTIPESDETNNDKTITCCSTSLSDLVVQDITWYPTNPSIGDQVTFTTIIKNQGSGSSSNNRVYFYLDGSTSHLTYKDFGGLSAGATTTVTFAWNVLSGSHTFRGLVDKDNTIPESVETNNDKTITCCATSLSDLVVQDITWSPTNPSIGETITFTTSIKNQGNGSSGNTRVFFYLDGSTNHLTYKDIGGISAGATTTVSFTWNVLSGSHTFKGIVDKDNSITESDETNNDKTITCCATSLSDLVVQDITWTPQMSSIGETITFSVIIKNQGSGSSKNGNIFFYLDDSKTHFAYKPFNGIASDYTTTVSFTWAAQGGLHSIKAIVDKENIIPESDETNNEKNITFSMVSLPDLIVENISWTPTSSSIGETITFLATIKNQGNGKSGGGKIQFYLDQATSHIALLNYNEIAIGSTSVVSFTWNAQKGAHSLKAIVDKDNTIIESDETNNEKIVSFALISPSDLKVEEFTWTPSKPSIGNPINLILTIKNQGNGRSSNGNVNFYLDNSANYFATVPFKEMLPGWETKVSSVWIAQIGMHKIKAVIVEGTEKTENDITNNEETITISALDTTPPQITLNKPKIIEYNRNNLLEEGEKLEISYGANDDSSGIASIKIFINGELASSQNYAGNFVLNTDSLSVGKYNIEVVAIDKSSNKAKENVEVNVERTGPSVYFGSTKTEVKEGENAIITLSAVNPIGNQPMKVQLILKPPSGISVYGTEWIKGAAGSYTGEFDLEPGDNVRAISIQMQVNQPGTHNIDSEIFYEVEGKRIVQRDRLSIYRPPPVILSSMEVFFNSIMEFIDNIFKKLE